MEFKGAKGKKNSLKGRLMNFGGLEKTISSSLREKNVVKFGILDKINFDDLQEKR